jgi:hypothetical protein
MKVTDGAVDLSCFGATFRRTLRFFVGRLIWINSFSAQQAIVRRSNIAN